MVPGNIPLNEVYDLSKLRSDELEYFYDKGYGFKPEDFLRRRFYIDLRRKTTSLLVIPRLISCSFRANSSWLF